MMKKYLLIASTFILLGLTACANQDTPPVQEQTIVQQITATEVPNEPEIEQQTQFVLEYPSDLQALGFTEPIVLDSVPERVAIMSVSPVMVLYELGVGIVAVPQTALIEYPESLDVPRLPSAMADDFDIEMVVSLEPDLVIVGFTLADTHGATLESLGIPVYYVMAGHVVPYESIRLQTTVLIEAFSNEENVAAGRALEEAFESLERDIADMRDRTAGMTAMVLQGDSHIQTERALLGSMLYMLGVTNVTNMPGSLIMIDFEQALYYDPDWVFSVGSAPTAQLHREFMEASFATNQAYWDSIPAVYEGRIVYLPVQFVSSAGIAIIDLFHELMEILEGLLEG